MNNVADTLYNALLTVLQTAYPGQFIAWDLDGLGRRMIRYVPPGVTPQLPQPLVVDDNTTVLFHEQSMMVLFTVYGPHRYSRMANVGTVSFTKGSKRYGPRDFKFHLKFDNQKVIGVDCDPKKILKVCQKFQKDLEADEQERKAGERARMEYLKSRRQVAQRFSGAAVAAGLKSTFGDGFHDSKLGFDRENCDIEVRFEPEHLYVNLQVRFDTKEPDWEQKALEFLKQNYNRFKDPPPDDDHD